MVPEPPGRRFGAVMVAAVAVVALLLGVGAGYLLGRPSYPTDTSVDAGFARDMSTHHGQAVGMAMTEYRATADPLLRQVSVDIGLTQQAQIGMMRAWLELWGLPLTGSQPPMAWMAGHDHGSAGADTMLRPDGLMPGMATPAELEKLKQATGTAKDILFCQLMIRHHRAGIVMAQAGLERATRREVRDLAKTMVDGQQYEVTVLTDWLAEHGARPLAS